MKKFRILVVLALLLTLLAGVAQARQSMAISPNLYVDGLNARKVHLREAPATTSKSLGLFYTGTPVTPLGSTVAGWMQVQIGTERGYMSTNYLTSQQPQSKAPTAVVSNPNSTWAHLRQGATRQAQSIGRLYNNDVVYVLGELSSGWSYIRKDDQMGFVVSSFLRSGNMSSSTGSGNARVAVPSPNLQVVGHTAQGDKIICLRAPDNGYAVYFVSQDQNPSVYWHDVNFDGRNDLVVATARGTSNEFCMFFVRSGSGYQPVQVFGIDYDLCNYTLHADKQIVESYANNGSAGAEHEYVLFKWNGNTLKPIRRAVTVPVGQQYKVTVTDYTSGLSGGFVMMEQTVSGSRMGSLLTQELNTLWDGI